MARVAATSLPNSWKLAVVETNCTSTPKPNCLKTGAPECPESLKNAPEPERRIHYFAFNRNKRGITLNLTTEAGRDALLGLSRRADFLIESALPGAMALCSWSL